MLQTNKKKLDWWIYRERLASKLSKVALLLSLIGIIFFSKDFFENKYLRSTKTQIDATFKSGAESKFRKFCFFELASKEVISVRCQSTFYLIGQKVTLNKVTSPSGEYHYEVASELPN